MKRSISVLAVEIHQVLDAFSAAGAIGTDAYGPCIDVHVQGDVTVLGSGGDGASSGSGDAVAVATAKQARTGKDEWVWDDGTGSADVIVADGATSVEIVVRAVPLHRDASSPPPRRIVLGCVTLPLHTLSTSSATKRWYTLSSNLGDDSTLPAYLEEGTGTILPADSRGVCYFTLFM